MSAQPTSLIKACLGGIALLAATDLTAAQPAPAGTWQWTVSPYLDCGA